MAFFSLPLKRFYKFVLKRLLGGLLQHELDLNQLEVGLVQREGTLQLEDLDLDVVQFDEALLGAGIPLRFVSGALRCIKMAVPWTKLLSDNCKIYVGGLDLRLTAAEVAGAARTSASIGGTTGAAGGPPRGAGTAVAGAEPAPLDDALRESHKSEAGGHREYSEDGIVALSRLVKLVLSRVEICCEDLAVSLLGRPEKSALHARISSIVVFSESPSAGIQERCIRLTGLNLALAAPKEKGAAADVQMGVEESSSGDQAVGDEDDEFLLLSTDGPRSIGADGQAGAARELPATVSVRQLLPVLDEGAEAGAAGASPTELVTSSLEGAGVNMEVAVDVQAIRLVLAPASWRALIECFGHFGPTQEQLREEAQPPLLTSKSLPPPSGSAMSASSRLDPSMVRSFVASTLPGTTGSVDFWSDLYELFEADGHVEDAARDLQEEPSSRPADQAGDESRRSEDALSLSERQQAEERAGDAHSETLTLASENEELDIASVQATAAAREQGLPVVGFTVRLNILHIGVLLVVSETKKMPAATDVSVRPGASEVLCGDHLQLCIERLETVVEKNSVDGDAAAAPTLASSAQSLVVLAHRYTIGESCGTSRERSSNASPTRATPEFVVDEEFMGCPGTAPAFRSAAPPMESYIDPAMFQSVRSVPGFSMSMPPYAEDEPVPRPLARDASGESCLTEASFGGLHSEDESLARSCASSVRSFEDATPTPSAVGGFSLPAASSSLFQSVREPAAMREPVRPTWLPSEEQVLHARHPPAGAVHGSEAKPADGPGAAGGRSQLEALFFDRARSIRAALLEAQQEQGEEELLAAGDGEGELPRDGAGWLSSSPRFRSKRLLRLLSLAEAGQVSEACASGLELPLTLLPVADPLWGQLKLLANSGSWCAGKALRAEWIGSSMPPASRSPVNPSLQVELQPILVSLCAESVCLLSGCTTMLCGPLPAAAGASWPRPEATGADAASAFASSSGCDSGTFRFVGLAPLLRLEFIVNGGAPDAFCCLVSDQVAPVVYTDVAGGGRVVDQDSFSAAGAATTGSFFDENLRLELADIRVYLLSGVDEEGERGDEFAAPGKHRCLELLSLGAAEQEEAKATLRVFNRIDSGAAAMLEQASPPPTNTMPLNRPEPAEGGLSDWTKISELPAASATGARSSLVLQDLRDASQRLFRANSGRHGPPTRTMPRLRRKADAFTGSKEARYPASCSADVAAGADTEIEIVVPKDVEVRLDSLGLASLLSAFEVFAADMAALSSSSGSFSQVGGGREKEVEELFSHAVLPPVSSEVAAAPAGLKQALNITLQRVRFEILDTVQPGASSAEPERLFVQLAPVRCRALMAGPTSCAVCGLVRDVRLQAESSESAHARQFVRPWFRPLLDLEEPAAARRQGTARDLTLGRASGRSAVWEAPTPQRRNRATLAHKDFLEVAQDGWRDRQTLCLQLEQNRTALASQTDVAMKCNRVVVNAEPELQKVITRLQALFAAGSGSGSSSGGGGVSPVGQPAAPAAASNVVVVQVSVLNPIIDVPSEAYSQSWPITSPNGLSSATERPAERGLDVDKWRALIHLDSLEASCALVSGAVSDSVHVCCSDFGVFVVDHPSRLTQLDLLTASRQSEKWLLSLGFARILTVDVVSVDWRPSQNGANTTASSSSSATAADAVAAITASTIAVGTRGVAMAPDMQSLEVDVRQVEGRLRADSVRCLLCAATELLDRLPQQPKPARRVRLDSRGRSLVPALPAHGRQISLGPASEAEVSARAASLSQAAAAAPAASWIVEDYIASRPQGEAAGSLAYGDSALSGGASSSSAAAAADHSEYSSHGPPDFSFASAADYSAEQVRELELEDSAARQAVAQLYSAAHEGARTTTVGGRFGAASSRLPATSSSANDGVQGGRVTEPDGSSAVWLVSPDEILVVQDYFDVETVETRDAWKLEPPKDAPPLVQSVMLTVGSLKLFLNSGEEFAEAPRGGTAGGGGGSLSSAVAECHEGDVAGRGRGSVGVSLQLEKGIVKMMQFQQQQCGGSSSSTARASSTYNTRQRLTGGSGGAIRQRLVVCARKFDIFDHMSGSAFKHVLAYFEDEIRGPRPDWADMLYLRLDKMVVSDDVTPLEEDETGAPLEEAEFEADLQVLPLKVTMDQDVIDFLVEFLQLCALPPYGEEDEAASQPPIATAAVSSTATAGARSSLAGDEAFASAPPAFSENADMRFSRVNVSALLLSVDYRAKRGDLLRALWRREMPSELPTSLDGLEIAFRQVSIAGADGLADVARRIVAKWTADFNRFQILRSFAGLPPVKPIANIGGGLARIVVEPLKQYQAGAGVKQIARSVLRGLASGMTSMTVVTLDLTERIVGGVQSGLEYASSSLDGTSSGAAAAPAQRTPAAIMPPPPPPAAAAAAAAEGEEESSGPPTHSWLPVQCGAACFQQPDNVAEGLQQAGTQLQRGLQQGGEALIAKPVQEFQRGAPVGQVVRSAATGIPQAILRPAIGATSAVSTAMIGMRNSLDPEHRREELRKYKSPE
eukprot:TRINITY_DN4765_c0_g3_i1.p1 TRINITY_DN4765_c0_g3~~TRINITY_DN4765_c0_g3_i1.p1  ORF type:complete len:2509 (-),score=547.20 TRINITY_DN4765_c0_g3_i1:122-7648(-)